MCMEARWGGLIVDCCICAVSDEATYGVKIDVRCVEHEWNLHLLAYQGSLLLVIWFSLSSSGRITTAKQPQFHVSQPELAVGETAMCHDASRYSQNTVIIEYSCVKIEQRLEDNGRRAILCFCTKRFDGCDVINVFPHHFMVDRHGWDVDERVSLLESRWDEYE